MSRIVAQHRNCPLESHTCRSTPSTGASAVIQSLGVWKRKSIRSILPLTQTCVKHSSFCMRQRKSAWNETMESCNEKSARRLQVHRTKQKRQWSTRRSLPINSATALKGQVWLVELLFRKEGLIWKRNTNKWVLNNCHCHCSVPAAPVNTQLNIS